MAVLARPSSNSPYTTRTVPSYVQKCKCTRHKVLAQVFYPNIASSYREGVGSVAYVSEVHAASIFWVEEQPFLLEKVVLMVFPCLRPPIVPDWVSTSTVGLKCIRLRHELPLLAQTLGSWVRIPLEAWISMCVYSVFVLYCL
jgi:hypothetical protein